MAISRRQHVEMANEWHHSAGVIPAVTSEQQKPVKTLADDHFHIRPLDN